MKYIVADWGDDCNGSRFTLHVSETLRVRDICSAIDCLDNPQDCSYRVVDPSIRSRLSMQHREALDFSGYVDDQTLCDALQCAYESVVAKEETSLKKEIYVYLMKDRRNGLYKIGKSNNPAYREATLQSEAPDIEMVFSTPERPDFSERLLHRKYADQRQRGEWFRLEDAQVRYICHTGKLQAA